MPFRSSLRLLLGDRVPWRVLASLGGMADGSTSRLLAAPGGLAAPRACSLLAVPRSSVPRGSLRPSQLLGSSRLLAAPRSSMALLNFFDRRCPRNGVLPSAARPNSFAKHHSSTYRSTLRHIRYTSSIKPHRTFVFTMKLVSPHLSFSTKPRNVLEARQRFARTLAAGADSCPARIFWLLLPIACPLQPR